MKTLDNKLIIYDSNCKVCSSLRDVVLALTSIPEAKVKAYKDLDAEYNSKVDPDKFKNVMALIDTTNGATIYGAEGVAYIFSSQYKVLDILLGFPPFFKLFSVLYKIQAYNRYIMATPKSNFKCDCYPDKIVSYRLAYIGIVFSIAILLTALFGISLKNLVVGISATKAAMQMFVISVSGWSLQIIAAVLFMKKNAQEYVGHLGSIMVVSLLLLLPSILFYFSTGIFIPYIPAISVLLSCTCMLYLHIERIKYLGVSQWWTVSRFAFLLLSGCFWLYYFNY